MFIKLLKEPLIQFFISGFILYIIYNIFSTKNIDEVEKRKKIYIGSAKNIDDNFLKLKEYEMVLLNEAYFLELYKQDREIENMLIKKMEYILQKESSLDEPSEELLKDFYQRDIYEYGHVKSISFYILDSKKDIDNFADRLNLLDIKPKGLIFKKDFSLDEIKKIYGKFFLHKVLQLHSKYWSKTIKAKDGEYIVYIEKKDVDGIRSFDSVEDLVYKDYIYQKTLELKREAFYKIKQHYDIKI